MARITVKVGDVISMANHKSGDSAKGKWLMIFKAADKGKKKMPIFLDNPDDVDDTWEAVKVKELSVSLGSKQDANGNWMDSYSVNIIAEKASGDMAGFMQVDEDIDDIFK